MTPEQHQRIGQLYRDALELSPEQRSSFLSTVCRGDAALQREVESLLCYEAHDRTMVDGSALQVLGRAMAVEQSTFWIGRHVSHYRILSLLDRGGMGEIYRARDTRLGRDVAIKALPHVYSADPARLQRFEQESRAAGQLNHPNVLTVYDIGVHDGAPFIVAELLDGLDLRRQLNRGRLPHGRALDYAQQIARGLAATHAKGIVHRDLKPENLFATTDGRVKILDFGLAKLTAPPGAHAMSSSQRLGTSPGLILGSIGYLSPEQLRGEQADHRADVFAFGVILYEMLTGGRPFERESPAEVMAAILKDEPPDLTETSRAISPTLNRIVRRCLEKNPDQRFQTASDLGFALDVLSLISSASFEAHAELMAPIGGLGVPRRQRRVLASVALLMCLVGGAVAGMIAWNTRTDVPAAQGPVARFVLPVQPGAIFPGDLELSPNGSYLAYSSGRPGAKTLYLRSLANPEATALAEIEGGDGPFFSPDSLWLGFFAGGKLKKISVHGGAPITLADAPANQGADWGEHGSIVFAPIARAGLFEVSANGGVPVALTTPDAERRETSHVNPRWLPGGGAVIYVARGETQADRAVMAFSREDRRHRVLLEGDAIPRYVSTGHLVYLHDGTLMAAPFDLERLELTRTPIPVLQTVATYGVSNAGSLIYAPRLSSGAGQAGLVWVNRSGQAQSLGAPPRSYSNPRLSPDGRQIAVTVRTAENSNIWIYDLFRQALRPLTFEGRNGWPVWSHNGVHVIYASNRAGTSWDIYRKPADGSAAEEPLLIKPLLQIPQSLTADGRILGLTDISTFSFHTSLLSMSDRMPSAQVTSGWTPSLSPDGRYVAYVSSETGRYEIYVRPTSGTAGKWLISTDGGVEPVWSAGGSELFYRDGDKLLAVDVVTHARFEYGKPRVLFEGRYRLGEVNRDDTRNYDVAPDGRRFLMLRDEMEPVTSQLNVVVNWFNDLQQVVGAQK